MFYKNLLSASGKMLLDRSNVYKVGISDIPSILDILLLARLSVTSCFK